MSEFGSCTLTSSFLVRNRSKSSKVKSLSLRRCFSTQKMYLSYSSILGRCGRWRQSSTCNSWKPKRSASLSNSGELGSETSHQETPSRRRRPPAADSAERSPSLIAMAEVPLLPQPAVLQQMRYMIKVQVNRGIDG